MDQLNVDDLKITNVSHYKLKSVENEFLIGFSADGYRYELRAKAGEDGIVYPTVFIHKEDYCKHCPIPGYFCHGLKKYKQELFHQLIEHPSIRLEWLYLNHV